MYFIYFFIGLIATLFGSLVGLGGGVIIKPALDTLNHFDAATISTLSSVTVFSMTIIALTMNIRLGVVVEKSLWWIAGGGVIGGFVGKMLFSQFILLLANDRLAKGIQSLMLVAIMILVIYLVNRSPNKIKVSHPIYILFAGIGLGTISSFLGIGGGPLNVMLLFLICGMDRKYAAFGSIFLIFASQGTKLLTLTMLNEWSTMDMSMLVVLIPGGILGGFMGSKLYRRIKEGYLRIIFNIAIILIACVNLGNAYIFLS